LDAYSSTVFEDAAGRIFDPEEKGVATSVTTDGSTLTLTAAEIGTTSTVIARSLWGRATQGTVLIEPTGWTNVSGSTRQWRTQAGSRVQSLTYTVGDLQPNRVYTVRKAGLALMTLNSGSTEMITFADVAGTTNEVVYSVEPAMQVFLERFADSFVLSWMGGRLQRATSLSPPNWQDLPMTNGQFRTNIRATELMEFFRALQP
jgi:hypothetical protein